MMENLSIIAMDDIRNKPLRPTHCRYKVIIFTYDS